MTDRQPTYPGRVTLTPVAGKENTYDMVMADEPTDLGTPPIKKNLLSDTTAAMLFDSPTGDETPDQALQQLKFATKKKLLSDVTAAKYFASVAGTETVDQVLSLLGRLYRGLGNEYVWEKSKTEQQTVWRTVLTDGFNFKVTNYATSNANEYYYTNLTYAKDIELNTSTGAITLKNTFPVVAPTTDSYSTWSGYLPFYVKDSSNNIRKATAIYGSGSSQITFTAASVTSTSSVNNVKTIYGYLNSPDSAAYPPTVSDGYTYTLLGQIGEKARIAAGSYPGTGASGSSSPNSLTLGFAPKIVILWAGTTVNGWDTNIAFLFSNPAYGFYYTNSAGKMPSVSVSGNTISWYAGAAFPQFNYSGITYGYLAIG